MLELIRTLGYREAQVLFPIRGERLHAMIASCGIERRTDPGYDWHGLARGNAEFVIFQYTISGLGQLSFEGRSMVLHPGEAMLLRVPHDHRYRVLPGEHWELLQVTLKGREILRLWDTLITQAGPVVRLALDGPSLRQAVALCDAVLGGRVTSAFEASSLAYGLAMALLQESAPRSAPRVPAWLTRVIRFCRDNLSRPIGVEDMAKKAGRSRHHFSRQFAALRGISPGQFLLELRMQEAVRLVRDTRLPVHEIAARCGYSSSNYFCKAFRKSFGVAPGAFRSSGMYGFPPGKVSVTHQARKPAAARPRG